MPQIRLNYRNPHFNNTHPARILTLSTLQINKHVDLLHGRIIRMSRENNKMLHIIGFIYYDQIIARLFERIEEYRDWIFDGQGG
jgi:hypothetical protein